MMTDFAALAMAWGAFRIAKRPANWRLSYGYDRVSILVAFVNGLTLFAIALWIMWEAGHRIFEPGEVLAGMMLWVAIAGLAVNCLVFWILMGPLLLRLSSFWRQDGCWWILYYQSSSRF